MGQEMSKVSLNPSKPKRASARRCPGGGKGLVAAKSAHGTLLICPACSGRVVSIETLCDSRVPVDLIRLLAPRNRRAGKDRGASLAPEADCEQAASGL